MRSMSSLKVRMAAVGAAILGLLLLATLLWRGLRESMAGLVLDRDVSQPAAAIAGLLVALLVLFAASARHGRSR